MRPLLLAAAVAVQSQAAPAGEPCLAGSTAGGGDSRRESDLAVAVDLAGAACPTAAAFKLRAFREAPAVRAAAADNSNPRAIALVARTRFRRPRKGRGRIICAAGHQPQSWGTAETAIPLIRQQSICRAVLICSGAVRQQVDVWLRGNRLDHRVVYQGPHAPDRVVLA